MPIEKIASHWWRSMTDVDRLTRQALQLSMHSHALQACTLYSQTVTVADLLHVGLRSADIAYC
jgi:hypothetical protein